MKLIELLERHPLCHLGTQVDNEKILKFYQTVPMKGSKLAICYDRSPNFFKFLQCHSETFFVFWFGTSDIVEGIGTVVLRPGYIKGEAAMVGYLGDLRFNTNKRMAFAWRKFYSDLLQSAPFIEEFKGTRHFLTAIIDENKSASNALMNNAKNSFQYAPKSNYEMINIFMRKPFHHKLKYSNIVITHAHENDLESIRSFLKQRHLKKPFGYQFENSYDELDYRLKHWPDFSISNILIAKENDKIVGVTGLWSPEKCKKIFIERIPRFQNLLFYFLKPFISLPKMGDEFKNLYLTLLTFDSSEVVSAFVHHLFENKISSPFHSIAICNFKDQCVKNELRGFFFQETPMTLYQVYSREFSDDDLKFNETPGFEMSLV